MKIQIRRENLLILFFLLILFLSIFVSSFYPIPAGTGEVGAAAGTLAIGDRPFYIDDSSPFSPIKGYGSFRGGFLYPKILEGISFVSIYVFQSDTTSFSWNILLLSLSSLLALAIAKFIFEIGKSIANERVGFLALAIYVFSPYTYFYVLSGGITIFVLFGVSLVSYALLKIIKDIQLFGDLSISSILNVLCFALGLVYLSCLRPSSILFSVVLTVSAFLYVIINRRQIDDSMYLISLFVLAFATVVSVQQFLLTIDYTQAALDAFVIEPGMFFGYPREVLRSKIYSLISADSALTILQGHIYNCLWKFMDFLSGINDIRDTHAAVNFESLFPFIARLSTGFFYLMPLSLLASLSLLLNFRFVFKSGLVALLFASLVAISPSLLGVAMSRYYFMFITPFILLAAVLIDQLLSFSPQFRGYFAR